MIKDLNKPEKGFGEYNNSSTRTRHILPVSSQMADKVDTTTQDASRRKAEDKAFWRDQNILGLERWLSSKHLCSTKLSSDRHVSATACTHLHSHAYILHDNHSNDQSTFFMLTEC